MLSFEDWADARRPVNDLNKALSKLGCGECAIGSDAVKRGYIYPGNNYIEKNDGADVDRYGRYTLNMSNWSQSNNDLSFLESELYDNQYAPDNN